MRDRLRRARCEEGRDRGCRRWTVADSPSRPCGEIRLGFGSGGYVGGVRGAEGRWGGWTKWFCPMWREWMVVDWHLRLPRVWGEWDRERGCTRSGRSAGEAHQVLAGDVACSVCEDAKNHCV